MRNAVKSHIKSCVECAFNKSPGGKHEGEYHYDKINPVPFHTVHVDHLGPFPKSIRRNEHILVIVDAFTKFTVIRAVKSTASKHVISVLNEVSEYLGIPTRIITDRGTAFTSHEFERYCHANDVKHVLNAVRTPRANGHAERTNRTKTPQQLLFGFTPRDILQNKLVLALHNTETVDDDTLQNMRIQTAEKIDSQREIAKRRYDQKHARPRKYNEGDLVLVENEPTATGTSRKLEPPYKGPFIITKALDRDRYVVEDLPGSNRKQRHYKSTYCSDKIKPWCALPAIEDDTLDEDNEEEAGEGSNSSQSRSIV